MICLIRVIVKEKLCLINIIRGDLKQSHHILKTKHLYVCIISIYSHDYYSRCLSLYLHKLYKLVIKVVKKTLLRFG